MAECMGMPPEKDSVLGEKKEWTLWRQRARQKWDTELKPVTFCASGSGTDEGWVRRKIAMRHVFTQIVGVACGLHWVFLLKRGFSKSADLGREEF
jgi:hypothetical protein